MVKLPAPPAPEDLDVTVDDLVSVDVGAVLWRIHRTSGEHVVAWNLLRYWGPATSMRFDPHRPPPGDSDRGVTYAARTVSTALAEVFQQTRLIDAASGAPYLTGWRPARTITLLDLTDGWPIRAGASHTLNNGRKDYCRAWARTIHTARPDLDGLRYQSPMTGEDAIALFTHAADSFPEHPALSLPLSHPPLRALMLDAAAQIGYRFA